MSETRDEDSGSLSLASELTLTLSGLEAGEAAGAEEVPEAGLEAGLGDLVLPAAGLVALLLLLTVDFPDVASIVAFSQIFQIF